MAHAPNILRFWREAIISGVRGDKPDLTMRQMAILMIVYTNDPPHTVRGLAEQLKVAKPVITRAIDTLSLLGYVKRVQDEADRRSVNIVRTVSGSVILRDLADHLLTLEGAPPVD